MEHKQHLETQYQPLRIVRTFVLRLVVEADDSYGQINEPVSADDWHVTFAGMDALWSLLNQRLNVGNVPGTFCADADQERDGDI